MIRSDKPPVPPAPEALAIPRQRPTHVPQRTCIGCRRKDDRNVLVRLVQTGDNGFHAVVVDDRRRMAGRGAWLHRDPSCLATALKRHAFHRAFRGAVKVSALEDYFQICVGLPPEARVHQPSNAKAGLKTDGNPMSTQR